MRTYALRTWVPAVLALLVAGFAPADDDDRLKPPPLEVTSHTLDNGLRVLLHEDHSAPVVNLQVWYHVGSKNEKEGRTGFAHLFEHLMFKGSENLEPEEHKSYVQDVGGRYNAYTSFDQTVYWETFPSNYLERMLWLEADRMRSLDVSEANFVSERDVVKEERRVRTDNPPFGRLLEIILDATYDVHPYEHPVIGSMADLDAATIDDIVAFHETYYVPNNATVVIAGDFESEQALAWVEEHFAGIPAGAPVPRDLPQEPAQQAEQRVTAYDANAPLPAVVLTYHVPEDGHPDIYALNIAGNILSAGQSSRLYRELVYDRQMAVAAAGQTLALEDPGMFAFFAIMNQGHTAEQGEEALLSAVEKLKMEGVTEEELEKAKNQFVSQLVFGRQSVQQKADAIGYAGVILGDPGLVNEQLARFQEVTAEDVRRVAQTYFTPENRTVVHMLPEHLRPEVQESVE